MQYEEPQAHNADKFAAGTTADEYLRTGSDYSFISVVGTHEFRIQKLESKNVKPFLFKNVRSERIQLKEPLGLILEVGYDAVIASCPDLSLHGVGETEQEALDDLSAIIEESYFSLKEEGVDNLGPKMLQLWKFMQKVVQEGDAG